MFVTYVKTEDEVNNDVHTMHDPSSVRLQPIHNTQPKEIKVYSVRDDALIHRYIIC